MYVHLDEELLQLAREPTSLNYGEILLLALIKNVDEFFMSNEAIANMFYTSIRTVKRWLSNLNQKELIAVYYENVNGKERRHIKCQI